MGIITKRWKKTCIKSPRQPLLGRARRPIVALEHEHEHQQSPFPQCQTTNRRQAVVATAPRHFRRRQQFIAATRKKTPLYKRKAGHLKPRPPAGIRVSLYPPHRKHDTTRRPPASLVQNTKPGLNPLPHSIVHVHRKCFRSGARGQRRCRRRPSVEGEPRRSAPRVIPKKSPCPR